MHDDPPYGSVLFLWIVRADIPKVQSLLDRPQLRPFANAAFPPSDAVRNYKSSKLQLLYKNGKNRMFFVFFALREQ
jgi:hypothetical protein